jgi:serine/threonine protein phosphatase PrpC
MSANLDVNNKIEWRNIINITKNMNDVLMIDESRNRSVNAATAICAIEKAFNQVNTNFIRTSKLNSTSGTTATIAMLFKNHLLISHVGDSRVVLCCNSDGHPIQATLDHTPYSQKEAQRVYDSGGFVEKNGGVLRVNGRLAITRSIGDKNMREVLSSTPDVLLINLEESNTMKSSIISNNNCVKYANLLGSANLMFMVLASDGLWDVVSNQDATEIVCEYLMNELLSNQEYDNNENYVNYDSLHNAAKLLAHEAYVRQSMDNIGVCVTMILK